MLAAQTGLEVRMVLRNGEQLLLTVVIPVLVLTVFGSVEVMDLGNRAARVDFLVPGVLALAVMSTAFTGLAIGTGFERRYGALKRLGASPLPRGALLGAKGLAVLTIEALQVALLATVAQLMGWDPRGSWLAVLLLVLAGTAAFSSLALLMAGHAAGRGDPRRGEPRLPPVPRSAAASPCRWTGSPTRPARSSTRCRPAPCRRACGWCSATATRCPGGRSGSCSAGPRSAASSPPAPSAGSSPRTLGAMLDRWRGWTPSPTAVRRVFLATLVANVGIVVTGGAVRLTASGLGCPTFPRCTDHSLVVTREMGGHGLVEFGNRMLTFALSAVVVAAVVVAWRAGRRDLRAAALLLFGGIVAQAVLGGVTGADRPEPGDGDGALPAVGGADRRCHPGAPALGGQRVPPRREVHPAVLLGGRVLLVVTALLLLAGTVVTGTGPHSGDKNATHRLPFDLVEVTQLHADLVFLLVGLTIGLAVALQATDVPPVLRRRVRVLLGVVLAQGLVGYAQYATDLPVALVAVHVLGACLVWVAALRLVLGMTTQVAAVAPARTVQELAVSPVTT
jgi:cytochrome c oxidase assembly protein subunit 15